MRRDVIFVTVLMLGLLGLGVAYTSLPNQVFFSAGDGDIIFPLDPDRPGWDPWEGPDDGEISVCLDGLRTCSRNCIDNENLDREGVINCINYCELKDEECRNPGSGDPLLMCHYKFPPGDGGFGFDDEEGNNVPDNVCEGGIDACKSRLIEVCVDKAKECDDCCDRFVVPFGEEPHPNFQECKRRCDLWGGGGGGVEGGGDGIGHGSGGQRTGDPVLDQVVPVIEVGIGLLEFCSDLFGGGGGGEGGLEREECACILEAEAYCEETCQDDDSSGGIEGGGIGGGSG